VRRTPNAEHRISERITTATIYDAQFTTGPAYWIPAFWVPLLLVTHYVTFVLLLQRRGDF
jgi:hypothetical protein